MSDLFTESLALQRIQLITRAVLMDVCSGEDKELALVWINELVTQVINSVDSREKH